MGIEKANKLIFIVSAGRTGTKFLGEILQTLSSNITSIHEPDRVSFSEPMELIKKIHVQGFTNIILKKLMAINGTRNISLKRMKGKITREQALSIFFEDRNWIENKGIYIEANWQLFGLVGDLATLPKSKVIIIVRDPRFWVKSWINKGSWYDKKDLLSRFDVLGLKRITPKNVGETCREWDNYSTFEKLCWVWNYLNNEFFRKYILYSNIELYKYEDIFLEKNEIVLQKFLNNIFDDNSDIDKKLGEFKRRLNVKINKSDDTILGGACPSFS